MYNKNSFMDEDIFHEAHNFINSKLRSHMVNSGDNRKSLLAFFGGEPLLNWKLIEKIGPKYHDHTKSIPTNGTLLTKEKLDFLLENNFGVSISFDGVYGNTFNRVDIQGNPTTPVFGDLQYEHMRNRGCKVMLYPNLFPKLSEIFKSFVDRGIFFPDFTLVRDDIYSPKNIECFQKNMTELTELVQEYMGNGVFAIPGIYSLYLLDTILTSKNGKRPFGCFAGTHGVGIMPDGKIYPCARFGSHQQMEIADSKTGT